MRFSGISHEAQRKNPHGGGCEEETFHCPAADFFLSFFFSFPFASLFIKSRCYRKAPVKYDMQAYEGKPLLPNYKWEHRLAMFLISILLPPFSLVPGSSSLILFFHHADIIGLVGCGFLTSKPWIMAFPYVVHNPVIAIIHIPSTVLLKPLLLTSRTTPGIISQLRAYLITKCSADVFQAV